MPTGKYLKLNQNKYTWLRGILIIAAILAGIFFLASTKVAEAATRTWDGGGVNDNWDTCNNWSDNTCPTSTDSVVFDGTSSDNVEINLDVIVAGFSINSGYGGIIFERNNNDLTINGAFSQAAGTFTGETATTTINGGNFTISGGTFTAASGTIFTGTAMTININATQTFINLTFNKNNAAGVTITSGDTLVVTGALTFSNGIVNTGAIKAQGSITQESGADGGTATVDFDSASAQTYTLSGGSGPVLQLDSAADASDTLLFSADSTLTGLTLTSGFSGTVTISNSGNYKFTIGSTGYSQAAGTFTGGSGWTLELLSGPFTISAGTFNAPATTTFTGSADTININSSQTFNDLTFNKNNGATATITSGDTLVVTGILTFTNGIVSTGIIKAQGSITQSSGADGGTATVDFDSASAQTYTLSGGEGPSLRLDSAADASDTLLFNADSALEGLTLTSSFSGTVNISNSGNYKFTIGTTGYSQEAGTFTGGSGWTLELAFAPFTITGGTFTAPGTVTFTGNTDTADVVVSQTFTNLTINKNIGNSVTMSSGDTFIVTGTLTLTDGLISGGTVEPRGNVTVASTFDGGTAPLIFSGSSSSGLSTQTFDLTGATGLFNADITINKSEGQVNLLSALVMDAASQDLTITEGTLDLNGQSLTVNGTSGVFVVADGGTLQLQGGEAITANTNYPQLDSGSTVNYDGTSGPYTLKNYTYYDLVISGSGTFNHNANATTTDDFTQSAGTLTAPSGIFKIGGDFTHSGGTFTHNSGSVILNGGSQTISGSTTFNNFSKSTTSADTLTFPAGATQTIVGTMTLEGASGNLLSLRSSINGTQARIDPQGTRTVNYLDVKDNYNINATVIDVSAITWTDSGNNTGWGSTPEEEPAQDPGGGSSGSSGSASGRRSAEQIKDFLKNIFSKIDDSKLPNENVATGTSRFLSKVIEPPPPPPLAPLPTSTPPEISLPPAPPLSPLPVSVPIIEVIEGVISNIGDSLRGTVVTLFGATRKVAVELQRLAVSLRGFLSSNQLLTGIGTLSLAPILLVAEYTIASTNIFLGVKSVSDVYYSMAGFFQGLLTSVGLRKRRRYWGTVYDSTTKQPLDPVIVELVDQESGRVVEQSITNLFGQFGFFERPGRYFIRVRKTHYSFPSKIVTTERDGIFENVYHGEVFNIISAKDVLAPNIPMDREAPDWNQEAKRRLGLGKLNIKFDLLVMYLLKTLFWAGFAMILFALLVSPSVLNVIFALIYSFLALINKYIPSPRLLGSIISKNIKTEGLLLELRHQGLPNIVVAKTLTREEGKFFLKTYPGKYILTIREVTNGQNLVLKETEVTIGKSGVMNRVIYID